MQGPEELNPANREFELVLRQINPTDTGIDSGEFAYHLGRASTQHRANKWRGISGALVVALGLSLLPQQSEEIRHAQPVNHPVSETRAVAVASPDLPAQDLALAYLDVRNAVLRDNLERLDGFLGSRDSSSAESPNSADSQSAQSLRRELIN